MFKLYAIISFCCLLEFAVAQLNFIQVKLVATEDGHKLPVTKGFLEVQDDGIWYRICTDGWNNIAVNVACGNLGFPAGKQEQQSATQFRNDLGIGLARVQCSGTEILLNECNYISSVEAGCQSSRAVILSCQERDPGVSSASLKLRLKGGANIGEGRLEISDNNIWGSICSNLWNFQSASVACRQLGYGTAITYTSGIDYGFGQGRIHRTNVTCDGDETNLNQCNFDRIPSIRDYDNFKEPGCSHLQTAGVRCRVPESGAIAEIFLLDGEDPTIGRVIVLMGEEQQWGSICSDNWSIREAAVACRQLGLKYAYQPLTDVHRYTRSGLFLNTVITNVTCKGDEESLSQCQFDRNIFQEFDYSVVNCGKGWQLESQFVGVSCTKALPDLQLDIPLLEGSFDLHIAPMHELECAASENCLSASAYTPSAQNSTRNLLRMTVNVWNRGTADFRPLKQPEEWEWHQCHEHYHSMAEFSHYDVIDATTFRKVAEGHKVSFCLADSSCLNGFSPSFYCPTEPSRIQQGISVGCSDAYFSSFDCQWIDMTDVAPGEYLLQVTLNPLETVGELDYDNNIVVCSLIYTGLFIHAHSCKILNDVI